MTDTEDVSGSVKKISKFFKNRPFSALVWADGDEFMITCLPLVPQLPFKQEIFLNLRKKS